MKKVKGKPGRPKGTLPQMQNYQLRLRPDERARLEVEARAEGVSLAKLIRDRALRQAAPGLGS